MISIQDLGLSILSDSPKQLYILGGTEYGVKEKYIDKLTSLYGEKIEYPAVMDVIDMMSKKHLIPLKPALYVVRYDESFVSQIDASVAKKVMSAKIVGTLVCLYYDAKHITKLDKYLPDSVGVIDNVNPKFIEKYLHQDFPNLDDRSIKIATFAGQNYGHSRNICKSMSNSDIVELNKKSEEELYELFGCSAESTEKEIQFAIANRNFSKCVDLVDEYNGNIDSLIYTILNTMLELEKVLSSKYSNSDFKDYAKFWKVQDIYYMFMNTYEELNKLRSNTSTNIYNSLIYLFGLLTFKDIPSCEDMKNGI